MKFVEFTVVSTGKKCLVNVDEIVCVYPALRDGKAYTMVELAHTRTLVVNEEYETVRDDIFEVVNG